MTRTVPQRVLDRPAAPGGLFQRLLPVATYAGRGHVLLERSMLINKRSWLSFLSGLGQPILYLFAVGLGFGKLAGTVIGPGGVPISYLAFVTPGLLAASAMNGAVYDSTIAIFFKIKYNRAYEAMLATPAGPVDIAVGELTWTLLRGGLYALGFFTVMLGMGLVGSPWALLVVPAALLVACGFGALGMAATTFMRSWQDFDLVQLGLMPMFLLSTTFFPLSVYPRPLQVVVECFPLYQGIEIMRALSSGVVGVAILGHLAYFVVMIALSGWVAVRRLGVLLLT